MASSGRNPLMWQHWLVVGLLAIGAIGFIHLAVQQNYRLSANDPQIQLAEDGAAAINQGTSPNQVVPVQKINRQTSLAPFVIVVNKQRQAVATNAKAGSDSPLPPTGIFDAADSHGEQRFSWQTAEGHRYATVVVPDNQGYVVAARSLKEVEQREDRLTLLSGAALLGVIALGFLAVVITPKR